MQDQDVRVPDERAEPEHGRDGHRRRNRRGRVLRVLGYTLILVALALGGYVWWTLWGTGFETRAAQGDLRPVFEDSVGTRTVEEAPPAAEVVKVPGRAVAILKIPTIDVDYVVVEGTDTESLKKGPGHYSQTSYPWEEEGAVGIAGHRTTYGAPFWALDELSAGDTIVLETEFGIFEYRVTRSKVIAPSDGSVLRDTRRPTLVLTTCTPRFSAAQRLIVFADRVD
ncbi:MAG TPA: sortase [Actinomycetota bacterium]|nr:sortase [Actinomycetota bacterium]